VLDIKYSYIPYGTEIQMAEKRWIIFASILQLYGREAWLITDDSML